MIQLKNMHLVLVYLNDLKDIAEDQSIENIIYSVINYAKEMTKVSGEWQAYKWRIVDHSENCVVLGSQHPEKLISLLAEYKDIPLEAAKLLLEKSGFVGQIINNDLLRRCSEKKQEELLLIKALRMVSGEYFFESRLFNSHRLSSRISEDELSNIKANPDKYAVVLFEYHI